MTCHLSTAWKTESGGFGNSIISLIIVILISYCVLSHREKGPVALLHNLLRLDEQVGLKEMYLSSVNRAVLSCFPQAASLQAELHNSSLPALFLSTPTKQVMSSVGPLVGLSLYQVLEWLAWAYWDDSCRRPHTWWVGAGGTRPAGHCISRNCTHPHKGGIQCVLLLPPLLKHCSVRRGSTS